MAGCNANNATAWKIFSAKKLFKRLFNLNVCLILGPQLKEHYYVTHRKSR